MPGALMGSLTQGRARTILPVNLWRFHERIGHDPDRTGGRLAGRRVFAGCAVPRTAPALFGARGASGEFLSAQQRTTHVAVFARTERRNNAAPLGVPEDEMKQCELGRLGVG
jgi:hypothetical protein